LDESLDVIDGDIPTQMSAFQKRISEHLHEHFPIDISTNNHHSDINSHNASPFSPYHLGTPIDETDIIAFNDMEMQDIDIPDYTDSEDERHPIDPMKLIATKRKLRSNSQNLRVRDINITTRWCLPIHPSLQTIVVAMDTTNWMNHLM
jgi:hypothetical protein